MNDKGKLISEKDVEEIAFNLYKQKIKNLQEKEEFLSSLPYNDEYPRLITSKHGGCHAIILRSVFFSIVFGALFRQYFSSLIYSKLLINFKKIQFPVTELLKLSSFLPFSFLATESFIWTYFILTVRQLTEEI